MSQNGSPERPSSSPRDTVAAWMRMLTVTGDRSLSLKHKARRIREVNGPVRINVKLRRYKWPWQRAAAEEALDAANTAVLELLNRYLITAILSHEHLIARLRQATGETREQVLQELSISIEQQITAAEDDTSHGDDDLG